ncbi:MAG TPA: hypothetical protein DDY78_20795 [Planctomycetales bacterium]|jgi:hypothetical protein|nr:hypothetical protein [Planctomycetales bacterium]
MLLTEIGAVEIIKHMDADDYTIPPEMMAALQHAVDHAAKQVLPLGPMPPAPCEDMVLLEKTAREKLRQMAHDDYTIPPEMTALMQYVAEQAARGIRDPEAMRLACEDMDRLSEEIFRKHGILDIGVPAIRALRDGDDE